MSTKRFANGVEAIDRARRVRGAITGREFTVPDVDSGYPLCTVVRADASPVPGFEVAPEGGVPDQCSYRLKLGLLLPSTNTSMEFDLWRSVLTSPGLSGIGLHTTPVHTPVGKLGTKADLENYKEQFLRGLETAVEESRSAEPHYRILGMSLEHLLDDVEKIESVIGGITPMLDGAGIANWHEAVDAALRCVGARRIAVLTPFDAAGNENASRFFSSLGYDVVRLLGFSCGSTVDIAHVPNWAKQKAVLEYLQGDPGDRVDAIVQCGTNLSCTELVESLEPRCDVPLVPINPTLLWFALRELGITDDIRGVPSWGRDGDP